MAHADDRGPDALDHPVWSTWPAGEARPIRAAGPLPIGDFLPRLQSTVRWIRVRVWRDGRWQVAWIVIRSIELVHVTSNRVRRPRRSAWRGQA